MSEMQLSKPIRFDYIYDSILFIFIFIIYYLFLILYLYRLYMAQYFKDLKSHQWKTLDILSDLFFKSISMYYFYL